MRNEINLLSEGGLLPNTINEKKFNLTILFFKKNGSYC